MLFEVHPKLPMRNKKATEAFYVGHLGFRILGDPYFESYLMLRKEEVEIHFFAFPELDPKENYGQVYIRTNDIADLYQSFLENHIAIHPNGKLEIKPWGQKEFSILDPDYNLLTFGEKV